MSSFYNKISQFFVENKKASLAVGGIALLIAAKSYFRGTICNVDRRLDDQVIVITGGNSGIGKETVQQLSHKPCTIIFGARDHKKSEELLQHINSKKRPCRIFYFQLDLADKKSIQQFSRDVKTLTDRVDILINNAGLINKTRKTTKDGFEMTMGVNHLGHFYLTYLLWDTIKKTKNFRIINVASSAGRLFRYNAAIDFNDFNFNNNFKGYLAYTRSKIANILFTRQLQALLTRKGIQGSTYSLNPGVIPSDIGRDYGVAASILKIVLAPLLYIFTKTPWEGTQTTLYLVNEDENKLQKGQYYRDCKVCQATQFCSNMQNAERLWKVSEEQLGIKFEL